jgi:dihydrofolate synthase/folylpolyglutamate synthase
MQYRECLDFLADLGHELRSVKFSLEPVTAILAALRHPERSYPTAIIAGTNGKGSTCAMLASILERAGYRTGLYTSPHLVQVNERIRINGRPISDEEFARAFSRVSEQIDRLLADGQIARRPSFFEYLTATAFLHFAWAKTQFVVLEVGMGGRLDATNVTDAAVAVITNVELDHQQFLGNTHGEIAKQKAGIIKPKRPVLSAGQHPEAVEQIRRRCRELGAELAEIDHIARITNLHHQGGCYGFDLQLEGGEPLTVRLPLAGSFQIRNAVAAAAAAQRLAQQGFGISWQAIQQGLEQASWPGRCEVIHRTPRIVLDGAHNPAAARELANFAIEQWSGRTLRLVYASMQDKSVEEISQILFPLAEEVLLTQCDVGRAATPNSILVRSLVQPRSVFVEPNPVRALELAVQRSAADDVVLVAGSLFLVGAIKKAMLEGKLALTGLVAPVGAA